MSTEVTLPALGESVTEGTVSRWLKQVGDTVEADEPLLEISTDKVDTEIPSPSAGVLLEIRANEDETVEVGAVLALIGEENEAPASGGAPEPEPEPEAKAEPEPQSEPEPEPEAAQPEPKPEQSEPAAKQSGGGGGSGTEVVLPALGESVTEGTVSRWLKQVGEPVAADEPLLEVSTDKVDTELPSPAAGVLLEIKVQEDETVQVGAVLAIVGDKGAAPAEESAPDPEPESEPESESESEPESESAPEPEDDSAPAPGAKPEAEKTKDGDEGGQEPIPAPEPAAKEEPKPESKPEPKPEPKPESKPEAKEDADPSYVTPLVRKLAREHDVDLSAITGTGVGGRIRKQDVLAAAEEAKAEKTKKAEADREAQQPAAVSAPGSAPSGAPTSHAAAPPKADPSALRGTTEKMSRLRKTIARRMVESLQVSAQLTATVEVDLTEISRIRARYKNDFKAREGASLSYLPFITKAVVEALKVFPKVNGTIDTEAGEITYPDAEHVGIAVDTERGLLVPVIADAGDLNIAGLAKKIADLAARTRQGKVGPDELSGGTFTITNYGSAGTLMDTPIVNQPQVAILGTGALVKRPVVLSDPRLGEVIAVRDMMYLSMSYDHRLVDGADAARFLSMVKARLEEGDFASEFGG